MITIASVVASISQLVSLGDHKCDVIGYLADTPTDYTNNWRAYWWVIAILNTIALLCMLILFIIAIIDERSDAKDHVAKVLAITAVLIVIWTITAGLMLSFTEEAR